MRANNFSRLLLAALAAGCLSLPASGAVAGERPVSSVMRYGNSGHDWRGERRDPRHHGRDRWHKNRHRNGSFQGQPLYGAGPLPDRLPGGTYSGDIEAERDRGNGNYFSIYSGNSDPRVIMAPKHDRGPKIIRVKPGGSGSHCHNSGSVCVIRP